MPLQKADWHDLLQIFGETGHIWSAGLSPVDYRRFYDLQMQNSWFRRNCDFLAKKTDDLVLSSCKLYTLPYSSRGRSYKLAGLGAVYTQKAARNCGNAADLINEVIDFCEDNEFDGLALYSEINPDFYADFGFEEFGSVDFNIQLSSEFEHDSVVPDEARSKNIHAAQSLQAIPLTDEDIPFLLRHYTRWLREQPFGVQRSDEYWRYKIRKETFLNKNAKSSRPALSLIKVDIDISCSGYAIIEIHGENLRVLEIVGTLSARKIIWLNLLTQILKGRVKRLRGWEAVIRDLEPTYKIQSLGLDSGLFPPGAFDLFCSTREWGQGMILCLNPELEKWLNFNPCPLLELDHL